MAQDMNVLTLVGRLTRDPEVKTFPNGTLVKFSLASNYYDAKNPKAVSFFDCEGWRLDKVVQYLSKGQQVCVTGEIRQQTWTEAATGAQKSKVVVIVSTLQLLAKPAGSSGSYALGNPGSSGSAEANPWETSEDQIPF